MVDIEQEINAVNLKQAIIFKLMQKSAAELYDGLNQGVWVDTRRHLSELSKLVEIYNTNENERIKLIRERESEEMFNGLYYKNTVKEDGENGFK